MRFIFAIVKLGRGQNKPIIVVFMRFISAIVKLEKGTIQANHSSVHEVHIGYCKARGGDNTSQLQ